MAGSRKKSERLQLILAKPVYTDGGKLHYFCEGRGGGGEGGGLAEFTEVVYKLKEGRSIGSEHVQCVTHYQALHQHHP